jgi:hypothetical protein
LKIARVCELWDLPFANDIENENNVSLHNRSYLHYASNHQDLVSAKSWATKWLLNEVVDVNQEYSVKEYMAGIGLQSIIIQNLFKVRAHFVGELDENCVNHLKSIKWKYNTIVEHKDAKTSLEENDNSDLKFLDLPNSSILQIETKWKNGFYSLFNNKPKLVVWTDTSVTYPMKIHGEKYSKLLNAEINDKYDYVKAYSNWLYERFNYSIKRAAFRGSNAVYFAAVEGEHKTEIKEFPIKEYVNGFYFVGEKNTLDNYL